MVWVCYHSDSEALSIICTDDVRFDWGDGEPNNYDHHEMCLALWEHHDPFFPIVRSFYFLRVVKKFLGQFVIKTLGTRLEITSGTTCLATWPPTTSAR